MHLLNTCCLRVFTLHVLFSSVDVDTYVYIYTRTYANQCVYVCLHMLSPSILHLRVDGGYENKGVFRP